MANNSVQNTMTSETGKNPNCSVSVKTIPVNNGNETAVKVNPSGNASGNTNLSYVGKVTIGNSDKKLKNYKVFQYTIKPPEAKDPNVEKYTNDVDMQHAKAKPLSRTGGDRFSTKTGEKQSDTLDGSKNSVKDIIKRAFSNTENRNLFLQNITTAANNTVNSKTNNCDSLNLSNNCSSVIGNESDNNNDCVANLNNCDSSLNESQSNSDNKSDKNDCTANDSYLRMNEDSDCATYLNNYNSSLIVNDNSILTLPTKQRMMDSKSLRMEVLELKYSNSVLRKQILRLKKDIEDCQPKMKTKMELLNQFNIEALEKGIENKDAKSLFLNDQLRSLTRDRILWSESSLEFMRRLVKKFPESYDFLKQADVLNLPNPRVLGCKKLKRC